jgi:hypothetical protein
VLRGVMFAVGAPVQDSALSDPASNACQLRDIACEVSNRQEWCVPLTELIFLRVVVPPLVTWAGPRRIGLRARRQGEQ